MSDLKLGENTITELDRLLTENVQKAAPGIGAEVRASGRTLYRKTVGRMNDPQFEFTNDTVYDMASLTKPIVSATLALKFLDRGKIALDDTLAAHGLFNEEEKAGQLTIKCLITHTSGLIWHYPLYSFGRTRDDYKKAIRSFAANAEMYTKEVYSDLNFMSLAFLLEHISGKTLDILAKEEIFGPLGMNHSGFNPQFEKEIIAPTELTKERGLVWGNVHDENSFYLGGVAGHAGLFSNLEDVSKFVDALLEYRLFSERTFRLMTTPFNEYLGGVFGLGWMMKRPRPAHPSDAFGLTGFIGDYADYGTFGHTGFTGTSLIIDAKRKLSVTLLSNRVHPTRDNLKILRLRRLFHNAVMRGVE